MSGRERMIAAVSIGLLIVGISTVIIRSQGKKEQAGPPIPTTSVTVEPTESTPSIEPTESIEPTVEPTETTGPSGQPTGPIPEPGPTSTSEPMPNTGVGNTPVVAWSFLALSLMLGIVVRRARAR